MNPAVAASMLNSFGNCLLCVVVSSLNYFYNKSIQHANMGSECGCYHGVRDKHGRLVGPQQMLRCFLNGIYLASHSSEFTNLSLTYPQELVESFRTVSVLEEFPSLFQVLVHSRTEPDHSHRRRSSSQPKSERSGRTSPCIAGSPRDRLRKFNSLPRRPGASKKKVRFTSPLSLSLIISI